MTTPSRTADVSGDPGHPGVSVDPSLEERLTREILQSERFYSTAKANLQTWLNRTHRGVDAKYLQVLIPLTQVHRDLRLRGATNLSEDLEEVSREVRR